MFFWIPLLLLGLLSLLLNFNGLYGQDAHEYLRMSQVFAARLAGETHATNGIEDAEMAGGYPILGGLLQVLGLNAVWALQLVSWFSAAACVWLFERLIRLTSPGSARRSRVYFVILLLGMAPVFVRAGCCSMSDGTGLFFTLATVYHAILVLEKRQYKSLFWVFAFTCFAVTTLNASLILLSPLLLFLVFQIFDYQQYRYYFYMIMGIVAGILPYIWNKSGLLFAPVLHSLISEWSVAHFFERNFDTPNGIMHCFLPNLIYVFSPLAHFAFCLPISGLYFLWRKTDLYLQTQKTIVTCIGIYLLFLAGFPHQNLRFLIPAYMLFLLLVFPAWDRMVSYGFYFFKKITWSVLAILLVCQLAGLFWLMRPVMLRHEAEKEMASTLRKHLSAGDVLFGFDFDGALRNYLPELEHFNLSERQYTTYPNGSYLICNVALLEKQWVDKNPMLNWILVNDHYKLAKIADLPSGWSLFLIK